MITATPDGPTVISLKALRRFVERNELNLPGNVTHLAEAIRGASEAVFPEWSSADRDIVTAFMVGTMMAERRGGAR